MQIVNPQGGEHFYSDFPEDERDKYMAGIMYQSHASLVTGADYAATDVKIPKTYVVCTEDKTILTPGQYAMAGAMGAKIVELAGGHSPALKDVESKKLVELIIEVAG
jgi:hypothetical protein